MAQRRPKSSPHRRQPRQLRAQLTVEAVLDAVTRVLKREGVAGITTNRIAKIAGVSIGSIYQYFPDKHAIFVALRERHVDAMARLLESTLLEHSAASLEQLMHALIDAMIDAHAIDPALHDLLLSQVPHGSDGDRDFELRLHAALRLALGARAHEFAPPLDVERAIFVLAQLLESLSHAVVLRRPAALSLHAAKQEATRAILAYLDAHGRIARGTKRSRPRRG